MLGFGLLEILSPPNSIAKFLRWSLGMARHFVFRHLVIAPLGTPENNTRCSFGGPRPSLVHWHIGLRSIEIPLHPVRHERFILGQCCLPCLISICGAGGVSWTLTIPFFFASWPCSCHWLLHAILLLAGGPLKNLTVPLHVAPLELWPVGKSFLAQFPCWALHGRNH